MAKENGRLYCAVVRGSGSGQYTVVGVNEIDMNLYRTGVVWVSSLKDHLHPPTATRLRWRCDISLRNQLHRLCTVLLHTAWRLPLWLNYLSLGDGFVSDSRAMSMWFWSRVAIASQSLYVNGPIYIYQQRCVCYVAPNGLQSYFPQATDKFDASVDNDAWCTSTGQNSYIWFGSHLAAASQTLDVKEP